MTCSYCNKEKDIVKSHSSESCSDICASCMEQVVMMQPEDLFEKGMPGPYIHYIYGLAQRYVNELRNTDEETLPHSEEKDRFTKRDTLATFNRFRELDKSLPSDWMPILVHDKRTVIECGKLPYETVRFDGVHRIVLALVLNVKEVPVFIPKPTYKSIRERQYQTLVLPDVIAPGERPLDRWVLLPSLIRDKRIIDLGCNSGMDGIMNCILSQATYTGYDTDLEAIKDGEAVAKLYGIDDRCSFIHEKAGDSSFPEADILWLFSAAKVVDYDAVIKAISQSKCKMIILERHNQHDDAASQRILDLPYGWIEIGRTVTVTGAEAVRSLHIATIQC